MKKSLMSFLINLMKYLQNGSVHFFFFFKKQNLTDSKLLSFEDHSKVLGLRMFLFFEEEEINTSILQVFH